MCLSPLKPRHVEFGDTAAIEYEVYEEFPKAKKQPAKASIDAGVIKRLVALQSAMTRQHAEATSKTMGPGGPVDKEHITSTRWRDDVGGPEDLNLKSLGAYPKSPAADLPVLLSQMANSPLWERRQRNPKALQQAAAGSSQVQSCVLQTELALPSSALPTQ